MLSIFPGDQHCTTHQQAHREIIWENSRAFAPEWHRGPLNTSDSANVTVWKHQSVNKTLLCGSKGFQHCSERQKKTQQIHISPMSERKRPRVRLKGENCNHYLRKAKKVQNIYKKEFSMRRNNQDGYFSARYRCSLALSKLIAPIILQGETLRKKDIRKALLLGQNISNTVIL